MGESGQRLLDGHTGKHRGRSSWLRPATQRELPPHSSGGCPAGHWLPGLLRSCEGEPMHVADGEFKELYFRVSLLS